MGYQLLPASYISTISPVIVREDGNGGYPTPSSNTIWLLSRAGSYGPSGLLCMLDKQYYRYTNIKNSYFIIRNNNIIYMQ